LSALDFDGDHDVGHWRVVPGELVAQVQLVADALE
jgi:hypothetical protein